MARIRLASSPRRIGLRCNPGRAQFVDQLRIMMRCEETAHGQREIFTQGMTFETVIRQDTSPVTEKSD